MSATDEHETMILDCEKRESKLSDWERQFIDSLAKQIESRALSQRQAEALERIWDRVTS